MIILIPMGGKGSRFVDAGYTINKASLLTTDRHSGKKLPMVLCAMKDIPGIYNPKNKIICVDLPLHKENGIEKVILDVFPNTIFIHDDARLDQAYGCFLARDFLQSDEELFIAACDNGISYDKKVFKEACSQSDALVISHSNDDNIAQDPYAHSWLKLKDKNQLSGISIKQTISVDYMQDHATTGMFWFKHANIFLKHLEDMINRRDTVNGKYYVDKVIQYVIDAGLLVQYFDVRYIGWGTPLDYENYEKTIEYWRGFVEKEGLAE